MYLSREEFQQREKCIEMLKQRALQATEAWTDGRHDEDDKFVELDFELVGLANVTEGAARPTVLTVSQVEPGHVFVAWQVLVDGYASKSANDPAIALQPMLAPTDICKDAGELKDKLTTWSLKVAEYKHQFKVIDEAQSAFLVRAVMPTDIKR